MARTTLDIDLPVLRDLKRIQREEKRSLGQIVSELLASALAQRRSRPNATKDFRWASQPMGMRIDLRDKEAIQAALDGRGPTFKE